MPKHKLPDRGPFTIIASYRGALDTNKDKVLKKALGKVTDSGVWLGSGTGQSKTRDMCRTFKQRPAGERALKALKKIKAFKVAIIISDA